MKARQNSLFLWAEADEVEGVRILPLYTNALLRKFETEKIRSKSKPSPTQPPPLVTEPRNLSSFWKKKTKQNQSTKQCWKPFSKIIGTIKKNLFFTLNVLKESHCKDDVGTYLVMVMYLPWNAHIIPWVPAMWYTPGIILPLLTLWLSCFGGQVTPTSALL